MASGYRLNKFVVIVEYQEMEAKLQYCKAGRSYGLEVKAHRYGVDEVKENVTYPAIIHWNFNHFVVLCGFTKMQL